MINTHWLAVKMAEPTRTWPNFGTIPAPQSNPYTQIDAHLPPSERDLAVQRAVQILSQT